MKKQCQMCKKTKTVDEFHKSKSTKDGYSCYCAPCKVDANKRSDNKRMSDNREKFLNQRKKWHLKNTFGMTLERYNTMLSVQNNVCAICNKPETDRMLAVDHNHITGKIRGLLCQKCNRAIGLFDDNVVSLRAAADYLESN